MSRHRVADAFAAALTALAGTVLVYCAEYLGLSWRGGADEWPVIRDAVLLLGAGAAVLGAAAAAVLPRIPATAFALTPALALFGKNLLRGMGVTGTAGWAGGVVAAAAIALVVGWIGRRRAPRTALAVLAMTAVVLGWNDHGSRQPSPQPVSREGLPNILLMVLDTTRHDRLSVYGYDKPTTPELVRFAETSQVYDQAWSVAPWTPPSHASMFTGLLPAEHGVDGQGTSPALPEDLPTLQGLLAAAGYRTGGFPANVILTAPGWDRGFQVYQTASFAGRHSLIPWLNNLLRGATEEERDDHRTAHIFDRVKTWWSANPDAPRYAFINLMDAHRKYHPLDRDFATFLPGIPRAETEGIDAVFWKRFDPVRYRHDFTAREIHLLGLLYDAEIAGMDREIGRFLRWMDARGDLDRTIVVITSDHGERLGERGVIGHKLSQDPYLLRVPLIIRWPEKLEAARIDRRVQLDGLPGYLLHLAGLEAPGAMAANALDRQDRELVVAQLRHPAAVMEDLAKHLPDLDPSPYDGDWVFVEDPDGYCYELPLRDPPAAGRLTDFRADPEFTTDVSAEHPDRVARMRSAAEALPRFGAAAESDPSPETLEKLRALGYIR